MSSHFSRLGLVALVIAVSLALSACTNMGVVDRVCTAVRHPECVKTCAEPSVMTLAKDIDQLESFIDCYGSIVAKQPDVWGQARLTHHREEYEREMAKQLGEFQTKLQGSLSASDQAYLSHMMALSFALGGQQAALISPPPTVKIANVDLNTEPQKPIDVEKLQLPGKIALHQHDTLPPLAPGFAYADKKISLEPTIELDQRSRYLNHLHELRRINEGDDTADSPGYSLNLIRVPVSVLPGKVTEKGYGAEITMTIRPVLGDDLLPTTFRNLISNDLVDQLAPPLTQYLNDPTIAAYFRMKLKAQEAQAKIEAEKEASSQLPKTTNQLLKDYGSKLQEPSDAAWEQALKTNPIHKEKLYRSLNISETDKPDLNKTRRQIEASATTRLFANTTPAISVPATKVRKARLPFAPSQMMEVYDLEMVNTAVNAAVHTLVMDPAQAHPCESAKEPSLFVHFPDVQSWLQEEIAAAYRFLSSEPHQGLWGMCTPELAAAVRARDVNKITMLRQNYTNAVISITATPQHTITTALGWAVLVESALLNEQLVRDMKEATTNKGCGCPPDWLPYFLPDPPPQARQAFNAYVACRWPIHVFALDPVTADQNIADQFSRRRELQLALSLAFASGKMSARSMTNYARRIEHDFQTIAINRPAVGFAHGNDTFGWRFYPRFQTPDVESNLVVLGRDLIWGGPSKDADLRQRRLEPGPRECVAIVLMPSFVPYATLETSANWFRLTKPSHKELKLHDAMQMSRAVKAIETCAAAVSDADLYRDCDLARLATKVKQLSDRLPLQTMTLQVPYENTLGGFAMFNNGVTDLAPELYGWYGASEIDLNKPTSLFLMGNHFSVHQTRVIAGGKDVPAEHRELLSRQVMRVIVPAGCQSITVEGRTYVDIHVATPYGTTSHLLVPVCPPQPTKPAPTGPIWSPASLTLKVTCQGGKVDLVTPEPIALLITGGLVPKDATKANVTLRFAGNKPDPILLLDQEVLNQTVVVSSDKLKEVILTRIGTPIGTVFDTDKINPDKNLTLDATVIQLFNNKGEPIAGITSPTNALTINWKIIKCP